MATVTVYDPSNVVQLIPAAPPTDQSQLVAQLQAQVASLTASNAALSNKITAAKAVLV